MPANMWIDDEPEDDWDDATACNTPTVEWWLSQKGTKFFEDHKRHPMTLAFHPELYEPGEREQILKELKAKGSPTSPFSEFPNVGDNLGD